MWFMALYIFAILFWRACETLVNQPPGAPWDNERMGGMCSQYMHGIEWIPLHKMAGDSGHWFYGLQLDQRSYQGSSESSKEYWWISARLHYLQFISNGDTAVWHKAINIIWKISILASKTYLPKTHSVSPALSWCWCSLENMYSMDT